MKTLNRIEKSIKGYIDVVDVCNNTVCFRRNTLVTDLDVGNGFGRHRFANTISSFHYKSTNITVSSTSL